MMKTAKQICEALNFKAYDNAMKSMGMKVLTAEAQTHRDAFESTCSNAGCSCHIHPPCGYCAHPGNPDNQEDESCWEWVADGGTEE